MLTEEVKAAYQNVKGSNMRDVGRLKEHWDKLFDYYNATERNGKNPLHRECIPCYAKVYQHISKIIKEETNEPPNQL